MFGSLIRRKQTQRPLGEDDIAFESTTFSLSTAVPRPSERRSDERMIAMLRVAKLTDKSGREQLIRVRNVSAGGLMAEVGHVVTVGEEMLIEISSQKVPSTVVWIREGTAGFKFEQNIDLGELLAGRKQRHGFRPRPPRLEVNCKANVKLESSYYTVDVHDISLGGMKVEPIEEYCLGKKVVVVVESLRPVRGEIRWFSDRKAGIVFDQPLKFEELAEWVGKRLEMATLKASIKN
ncbi:PilZ domain-containing protein [Sphingomonas sp. RB56-2]|jgi:Tfp pilus assembly protein PilZ|uniref:PilZ domain-containing protein n=1 Tax=Sphingomonas brevis TaxID=2908206 RepID=A0ABT0S8I5_9SPHN|nr:PilZ domain-containing protein [Sphingomonas brevis]MCL6740437.1 PilZ domain-containing protein [Sphingomonas brevis]